MIKIKNNDTTLSVNKYDGGDIEIEIKTCSKYDDNAYNYIYLNQDQVKKLIDHLTQIIS